MYEYMKGKVIFKSKDYLILECDNIAYKIFTKCDDFELGNPSTIYIYLHISENERVLYGFKSRIDREVFLKFLSLKNIGIKTAFSIILNDDSEFILNAAYNKNYDFLLSLNKINEMNVDLLIKNLKSISYKNFYKIDDGYYHALKSLDYTDADIYKSYKLVDKSLPNNLIIKEGIKLIERGDL